MGKLQTIGGERLGGGKKMKAYLHGYERSTHDLSRVFRTTMSSGTLVPFLHELALPGDTHDIDLNLHILTHPTIGPLFGTYTAEAHLFLAPIRLYQAKLHMNMLGIGMQMNKVPLPQILVKAARPEETIPIDNQQVSPSCILSYLGIRGVAGYGFDGVDPLDEVEREFNAVPFLAYWDIFKQYYSNKQENSAYVIHTPAASAAPDITSASVDGDAIVVDPTEPYTDVPVLVPSVLLINCTDVVSSTQPEMFELLVKERGVYKWRNATELFNSWNIDTVSNFVEGTNWLGGFGAIFVGIRAVSIAANNAPIQLKSFPLSNIDDMKIDILQYFNDTPFVIDAASPAPYGTLLESHDFGGGNPKKYSATYGQEGLAIKTYKSDLFNNWIDTEFITGSGGINEITSIDTSGGSFTIDELNLQKKIYLMLNRIAISDGTYDAWLTTVYDENRIASAENPMYLGGLMQSLVFQEVVSNAAADDQPLGTLAGRGRLGEKRKGGSITVKVTEPSYIIGIISLTPNLDYSQGNSWDVNLKTLDDLHKPQLDEIGFQDLITDQLAWWDTQMIDGQIVYKSLGKQPAWINYMTAVNVALGNFADQEQQMWMVLNRRYGVNYEGGTGVAELLDGTTYIDPSKFNNIFADTRLDAQNFWVQIGIDYTARRKMSAKVMPNL